MSEELLEDDVAVEEAPEKLNLEVEVTSPSACERHVTVTISREDIDRYLDDAYGEMMATASVPGFRIGRAPRKLVESRFKSEVGDQIKGSLLMDSLGQISEEQEFTAISEPELNLDAVVVPDEGPMTFEFDIEVRPEFDMPKWKGLKIVRPTRDFTDEDVERQKVQMLARYGKLAPHDGPASEGDHVTLDITVTHEGEQVSKVEDRVVRVLDNLSFQDARLEGFAKLMEGAKEGDKKTAKVTLTADAPNEELRGKEVDVEFKVLEVKKIKLPELSEDFLAEIGNFESEEKFIEAIKANLERQLEYE
ncbi:MAG: trigger factor, partial [Lacipirellulaceae bacterium]